MIKDKQKLVGRYNLTITDKNGELKELWQENKLGRFIFEKFGLDLRIPYLTGGMALSYNVYNLVVNAGLAGVASVINGDGSEAAFTYLAVGTDDTAAAAGNTTLGTEITDSGLERASATASRVTTTVTNDTAQLLKAFSVTGTKAVAEVGVLNASSTGTMLSRTVITTKNVENGDTLTITYKISSANA